MIKSLLIFIFVAALIQAQTITPYYALPVQTTQNVITSYSFLFATDTSIASNAQVSVIFPFQFSPTALTQATRVRYSTNGSTLLNATWTVNIYTYTIRINQIPIGNITIVIDGILNPKDYTTSSFFTVQTKFKDVVVTSNTQFARVPFTPTPIMTSGGLVNNYVNNFIEQGSSWTFNFTLSTNYSGNSSLRFVFPQDFLSNKIQCNVSGIIDTNMQTRVFPSQNVYDCLNLAQPISGTVGVVLSGVVNPNYQMTASGFQVHILQPNNMIVSEIITSVSTVLIKAKTLNTTLIIPNKYRNNTLTYTFQINPDTNLFAGDYMVFTFTGLWKILTNLTTIISGVTSSQKNTPVWKAAVTSTPTTTLTLTNFSSILKTTQFTFYQPIVTPIAPATYSLTINSYRFNGGLAQTYTQSIDINQTTGYIREMKLHPMQTVIKLPVGQTGPLEIVLFLQNNLPQTNVLTWAKIVIQITPNIPAPILAVNGVPKCYFYATVPAVNCTFDSSNPSMTIVTIFTPSTYNFQQSQLPLTITTQGFQQPYNQGYTIDTLVKRYFFQIQFYTHLRPPPIPQEVIFDEWIPDYIPLTSLSCSTTTLNSYEYDHIKCSFTTPNQVLNSDGHIHFFRLEFSQTTSWGWMPATNTITPNYPCLMYGVNVSAVPYVKCDYVTWQSGPYKSQKSSTSYNYITFYGLSTIPGGSTITFQVPYIQRYINGWDTQLTFAILQDTPGYSFPLVYLYTAQVSSGTNTGSLFGSYTYINPSYTLSNQVINKVTDITLNSYPMGTSGISRFIFEVNSNGYPNIGRGSNIACGSHTCSKFDKPIQYFILYPSSTLPSSATLTFPNIVNPPYSGNFQFQTRSYQSGSTIARYYFNIYVGPDTITDCSYKFSALETISTLYPNSDHFYTISWANANPLQSQSGNSYIVIYINNYFTLSSTYCYLSTTVAAYDGRGIFCQLSTGGTQIYLKNLNDAPAGATFNLTIQMTSTATTSTISPTVTIQTYYGNGALVDQAVNLKFITYPLSNTNMTVLTTFNVPSSFISLRAISSGYFGHLLVYFQPQDSGTVVNGSTIILTMANGFYPAGNALNLPLSCLLNGVRFYCTYTLSPFTITITQTNSSFLTSNNVINITTLYQNSNGIYYPSTGRYLLTLQIKNASTSQTLQKVQQYVDILPGDIAYFTINWAHKDIGKYNLLTIEVRNGQTVIPSYNDATTAGRIYIGFPMQDALGNQVFDQNLGYTGISQGNVLPCYFDTGANFVTATSGKTLTCKIRMSLLLNKYYTWIQVINFESIPAGGILRIILGKVTNPSIKQIDINFLLRVRTLTVATNAQVQIYQTSYNMFIDMLTASITNRNQVNSSSPMFQPGSTVGQANRYFNITPYTGSTFNTNDWFVVDLDPQFPLNGNIYNCLSPFYQYCIIYPTINWLAVKIGNGTILPLQPFISQLPISISRVDTTYKAYTFLSGRWSETITYTVGASGRWLEIRGIISGFSLQVVGSQNKLNIGQKNVEVLVTFNVSHNVPAGGTIQIQFPSTNSSLVPAIKAHCRSAVSLGSALRGFNTGKPAVNVQGEVGCLVQNTYSWIITGFDTLAAGSQVYIYGQIDFPTIATNSLGMGYICTYSNQDSTSAFLNARTIDYLTTNFPLPVQNLTWNIDTSLTMTKTQPLRINYVGQFKFILNVASQLRSSANGGYIFLNLWYQNTVANNGGGFNGPTSNLVCTIFNPATNYKYGCTIFSYASPGVYQGYKIQSYQDLPINTDLQFTVTTQKGSATEGINFPTAVGSYQVQIQINYYSGSPDDKSQAYFIDVYGPDFNTLSFNSTVTIPSQNNFIMVIFTPSSTIATNQQFIIEIPTVSAEGQNLFPPDLGRGYKNYDDLVFDIFQSGISSMKCKVYTGQIYSSQPIKIICSNFNTAITTSITVKFGFWVVNPATTVSMAIPVQIYAFDQPSQTKFCWSIIEAGIRVLPITVTPINDIGKWASSSTYRQLTGTSLSFITRNTKQMVLSDWYILKFNFDLRSTSNTNGTLSYNTNLAGTGDIIFMRNCQTILLRIGTTALSILAPGSTTVNAKINSLFYNPPYQLTTAQASILAYAIYNSADACQKIIYSDLFPTLVPNMPSSPSFSMTSVYNNKQMGQKDDYRFSFTMSSSAGNSTSLVKLISISFPAASVYDYVILGNQCYEYSSSTIEVSSCYLDAVNRVIWITPVIKAYTNNNPIIIETAGLAIQNPVNNLTIDVQRFTIRYYTWPDGQAQPTIAAGSDNWCFMKQDSTTIASATISYNQFSNSYYTPHTSVSAATQVVVNQWQPADYFINNASTTSQAKSAFSFKVVAPTGFAGTSGSNYHTISLYFGSYYSSPTQTNSLDLFIYVPACELNGRRVHSCSISSGTITMNFQNSISNGQQFTVKFTVINPTDQTDQGFTLLNTANPTVVMPIYITPYGGSTYYLEPQPFQTYYRATSAGATYPSMGISNVAISWGTQARAQLNYLEFVITLTRNDINGFVLQIPVITEDGISIYNNVALLGLPSGSKYPCSMGVYASVYCYYIQGSKTNYGSPTRIYITDFSIPANNSLSFRMLFTNPDIQDVFPRFTFKAFGGSFSSPKMMGSELKGIFSIVDPYEIYSQLNYFSTGSLTCYPSKSIWQTQTYYDCYTADQSQPINTYAILRWPLVDTTYGQIGDYDSTSGVPYDHFFMSNFGSDVLNQMYVFVVLKLGSQFNPTTSGGNPTSYYRFGYLRMKHHIVNSYNLYLLAKDWSKLYTASASSSWLTTYRSNQFGTISIDCIDVQSRYCGHWSWHYFSVNTANAYTYNYDGSQASDLVVQILFVGGQTFDALSNSYTICNIESGVIGYNPLKPVTCTVDVANSKIVIRNVFTFTNTQLKVFYYARMACSQDNFDVKINVWANQDAYVDQNWPLIFATSNTNFDLNSMFYASAYVGGSRTTSQPSYNQMAPGANSNSFYTNVFGSSMPFDTGYAQVISASTTQIKVRLYLANNYDFYTYTYRISFRFYTQRLQVSGQTCSNVAVYSSRTGGSPIGGSWTRNCGTGDRQFFVSWYFYQYNTWNQQYQWPYWYAGDYYDFTFTFGSVTQDSNNYANSIYAQATLVYEEAINYWYDEGKCGCCSNAAGNDCCSNTCYHTCYGCDYSYGCDCYTGCSYPCDGWCCGYLFCCTKCSCRWQKGWGYVLTTNLNAGGWSQNSNAIAQSASIYLMSNQFGVQTQFGIYLQNLGCSLTSTMTSNSYDSSGQLVISFTGNNAFSGGNPFPYTSNSESAAYIQCLCVVSGSSITISAGTSYTAANCTRYVMSGYSPFITVRINANTNQYLACYFPGFTIPSSSSNGWTLYANFYRNSMNHFKYHGLPEQFRSNYQTTGVAIGLTNQAAYGTNSITDNGTFWPTYGYALQSKYYQYYISASAGISYPALYLSTYAPKTSQDTCNSGSYIHCRAYNAFHSRRYFLVAQYNGHTSVFNLSDTLQFPQSWEKSTANYDTYVGFSIGGWNYYYTIGNPSLSQSYFSPAAPTFGLAPATVSTNLQYTSSLITVGVDLSGFALYSNRRTQGPFSGSFAQLDITGFTTLNGCGVVVFNTPTPQWTNNALYCIVVSTSQIKIYSNADWFFTGYMYITLQTDSVPSSTTYTFKLYDKYKSSTDYGLSVSVSSSSFSRTVSGSYITLPSTRIKWRRQTYKDIRSDAGPVRVIFNNNYQYVSTYNIGNNAQDNGSDGILIKVPGSGLTNTNYYCYLRQYLPNQYSYYKQYVTNCVYYSTTQVLIKSIPSHILNPIYNYEIIIYKNTGSSSSLITIPTASNYIMQVGTTNAYSGGAIQYYDYIPVLNYLNTYPITLNNIYILTREAATINSLWISFTIGVAQSSSNIYYLQFIFDSFDLNYFNIANGGSIPCALSNNFITYPSKQNGPRCFGYADGLNKTTPLIIRVYNFGGFSSGTTFQIAFDNFNNPPVNNLILVPINLRLNLVDRTNTRRYTSYFPNLYYSDSVNVGVPSNLGGSIGMSSSNRGDSTNHYINLNWPYSSNYNDISQKIVMKIYGGITCCQSFSSLSLSDSQTSYTLLWTNTGTNTSVYRTPSKSTINTYWYINNVINPNQVSYQTYIKVMQTTFIMYSSYKASYITTLNQPAFSSYALYTDFTVTSNPSLSYGGNHFSAHPYYPLTLQFSWNLNQNSYNNRNISYIIMYFTSGVRWIDCAWLKYTVSPYYTNTVGNAKVGYDTSVNQWYVNITGVQDSIFSATYLWYARVRLYGNANYFYYTSKVYNFNGNLQFTATSGSEYLPNDNWSSSSYYGTPTTWNIEFQRYTKGYFELARSPIYAAASQTTNKLFFKFNAPYNMSQVENINLISSSATFLAPATPANGIYCIIQPTYYTLSIYGVGLYSPCTYASGTYAITIPTGGLTTGQYLLTIIDRKQLTTTFNMPTSPQRIEVSLIYNSLLNLQYGDVYTLDFAGMMTSYTVSHATLITGQMDMLGFTFTSPFTLAAATTTAPLSQSVLSFEIQSNYYDSCLKIPNNVFNSDGMAFYSGVYYSHFSTPAVTNANTRVLCGQNTQSQNWAPIKLTVTDYGAVTAGTSYFFRFPLITLPSGTNVPLTYKVKLLQYINGNSYPTIISQYNYENLNSVSGSGYNINNQWAYLSNSNVAVQKTMSVSFYYDSNYFNIYWSGYQTIVKFSNNNIGALTSLSTLPSLSTSGFNYQYYPNINLCSFIRNSNGNLYGFSLGTYPTSIDQQDFQLSYVYTFVSQTDTRKAYFNSGVNYALTTLSSATGWTSSSFTKGSNILTSNSQDLFTISWSANYLTFPEGTYMILTIPSNFIIMDEYCYSYSGFIQGTLTGSNIVCKGYSSNQIIISGYATLATSASLSIKLYLAIDNIGIGNYSDYVNIIAYSSANNVIINANTASYSYTIAQAGSPSLGLSGTMNMPYTSGNAFPLYIKFQLRSNTLVNGDYLLVNFGNWVIDLATSGAQIFKYRLSGTIYWVPSQAIKMSGNTYKIPVYNNYSMNSGNQITLWVDTVAPTSYYGAQVTSTKWNQFNIFAYKSGTLVEQQVTRIWTEPYGHSSFVASPALTYITATTLWEFSVTPNISANAGDSILIEFQTSDVLKSLFSTNLGVSIPSGNSGPLDCSEYYNSRVISNSVIQCRIYAGDNSINPSIPTTIAIPITLNIAANTAIRFNILNLQNPSIASYPMSVVFKLASPCNSQDSNNLCAYYKSSTYLTFGNYVGYPGAGYSGTLTFNPSRVSANNTVHTITNTYQLLANDFVKLTYFNQVPIPKVCTMSSTNGVCYSYSTTNTIIIKVNTTINNPYSIALAGMPNPYQKFYGSYTFHTEIWRSGSVWIRFYTDYTASTITTDPTTSNPLTISFVPILTPNYQLKYTFWNIANVTFTNMLQNSNVKQIYIRAPSEITLDTQYCNASLQTYVGEAIPYPYRFVCQYIQATGPPYMILNLFTDFPAWNNGFTQRSIYVYIRYQIANSQTVQSNNWYAYAYADPSSQSSSYEISYATGNFPIVQYKCPYLYVINFPQRSFSQRTCMIGQKCMIYGFIYPTTPSASITISKMTFLLPRQFNYSSQQNFDRCFIQSYTTTYYTFGCALARNSSQITIAFNPPAYNQLYNIFNIDHSSASMLFTAPNYPGDHYQMQVNLWSNTNTLVQSQYINLTTVYGTNFSVPLIKFVIPLDASQYGLFDLTFTTGSADILPSYINSATYTVTSAIEVSFANTFDASLGTGLPAGSEIACLSISGLTFNIMGKLTCKIYPSVSIVTYPTIIITGYDRIYAGTTVRIHFANLKTFAAGITDYCTLGASYTYYDYGGTKGYIYQPVSFIVGPTTAPNTPKTITYTISELSSNYVGQLTNYTLSGTLGSGFSSITTTDYFVVQFPQYIFEGRFNLNSKALCSLAASNKCNVFGLAAQIYIQPSSTVSTASFSFTIKNLLNAAFSLEYLIQNITLFTVVGNKMNAIGYATFTKFTQASLNVSAIITSIDSIYGGDSGINYYFSFQLNSYLPQTGKISIFFPQIYLSLFSVNSICYLRSDSQALIGSQAYCQIINNYQLVIVPNGVLLSANMAYYLTVTNITNPNLDLSSYKFQIETYYSSNVYSRQIISRSYFISPILSLITVKNCQLQVSASIYNQNLPSQYQINLICPATIKQSSELKLYLSWNPALTNLTCSSDSNNLYSTQCNIVTEYTQTTKLTYLSIYLRSIQAQKLVSITATITNGAQGTYNISSTINFNGFVYLQATSNSYYITGSSSSTAAATLTVQSSNYPLNRQYTSIYTFAIANPKIVVSTLQIDVPSIITQKKVTCGYQTWTSQDNYFNLMMLDGTNALNCNMTGQKLMISGLTSILSNLTSSNFFYLTVNGLINPSTSASQSNFTFTFINTTSTIYQAVGIYTLPLSYSISNPPTNLQISSIALSDSRYFVNSLYTFTLTSVQSANITIVNNSNIGFYIRFPQQYGSIWLQITPPTLINMTINGVIYKATNITMKTQYMFVRFPLNTFNGQVIFTNLTISFNFRNPNQSIDCTVTPVFELSLFDFQANSIFAQTLSNNQLCPTLTTRLFGINVTGNTKFPAGSSTTFVVSIQKPAYYLAITPNCSSSAITFTPSVIIFRNFTSTTMNFTISAAIGLNGNFNVTFSKAELSQNYYNDIQFTTLNIYPPTTTYNITITPFSTKSTGYPIAATFKLAVPSPTDFALTFTNNCQSGFTFNPTNRISIPAQSQTATFYILYNGTKVPKSCQLNFTISALTTNNFALTNSILYLSGKPSIDKSSNTPPLILELTTNPQNSTDVDTIIVSNSSSTSSSSKYYTSNTPTIYKLALTQTGSNHANFLATTSIVGTVYYAIILSGTPTSNITQSQIYSKNLSNSVAFGNAYSALNISGVNIIAPFVINSLSVQTNYIIGAYLNSTVGSSPIVFQNFSTDKASNGAAIKLAMSNPINITQLLSALSNVLRIKNGRIGLLTSPQLISNLSSTYTSTVMNNRSYIYEIVVAPDADDDSTSPISLLNNFIGSDSQKYMLSQLIPQYLPSYNSQIREIIPSKPRLRSNATVVASSHEVVSVQIGFWQQAYVYGVIILNPTNKPLSNQIINGSDSKNNPVVSQNYAFVTSDQNGLARLNFTLLTDNSSYTVFISASCVLPFTPRLSLNDSQVISIQVKTKVNLNLMKNSDDAVKVIAETDGDLARKVKAHLEKVDATTSIKGTSKETKRRNH